MGADLKIRIPSVHEPAAEPPLPCAETCLLCHGRALPCPERPGYCAPVCMRTMRRRGPVHVCIATTTVAARLLVRPSDSSSAYVTPWGDIQKPRPSLWPWLVVDHCPRCGGMHWHTITRPEQRWYRTAPCGLPYVLTLAPALLGATA
ncbi:hypothetical protein [Microtetraspora niveoalba]|uniref:hypothetical protein n=1 Tax=Microtetraspora niveoalba TaxID=46175 RepID=UPI000831A856|nr:hypothetical protein [Microtetraspora niveoalba]